MRSTQRLLMTFALAMIVAAVNSVPVPVPAKVYITNSGTKYHKQGCRYLKKSSMVIELDAAKKSGYTPCKVCKP